MNRVLLGCALVSALSLLALALEFTAPVRFEYRLATPSDLHFNEEMNALGREGWEVVSGRIMSVRDAEHSYELILKRRTR